MELKKFERIMLAGQISEFVDDAAASIVEPPTVGPDGNLWFAENGVGKIGRLTPSGSITEFGAASTGSSFTSLLFAPDHTLWFFQKGASKIGTLTLASLPWRITS